MFRTSDRTAKRRVNIKWFCHYEILLHWRFLVQKWIHWDTSGEFWEFVKLKSTRLKFFQNKSLFKVWRFKRFHWDLKFRLKIRFYDFSITHEQLAENNSPMLKTFFRNSKSEMHVFFLIETFHQHPSTYFLCWITVVVKKDR